MNWRDEENEFLLKQGNELIKRDEHQLISRFNKWDIIERNATIAGGIMLIPIAFPLCAFSSVFYKTCMNPLYAVGLAFSIVGWALWVFGGYAYGMKKSIRWEYDFKNSRRR